MVAECELVALASLAGHKEVHILAAVVEARCLNIGSRLAAAQATSRYGNPVLLPLSLVVGRAGTTICLGRVVIPG